MSEQDKCPQCKIKGLTYGIRMSGMKDEEVFYPVECSSCGFIGREYYRLEFVVTVNDEGEEV